MIRREFGRWKKVKKAIKALHRLNLDYRITATWHNQGGDKLERLKFVWVIEIDDQEEA